MNVLLSLTTRYNQGMLLKRRKSSDSKSKISTGIFKMTESTQKKYHLADFAEIPGTACPYGTARRAFADVAEFPGTLHVTEISEDAELHYHKNLTETYYFLECGSDAQMQLDDEIIPVHAGMAIVIPPGVRHRALGSMKIINIVFPKFDPADEWVD